MQSILVSANLTIYTVPICVAEEQKRTCKNLPVINMLMTFEQLSHVGSDISLAASTGIHVFLHGRQPLSTSATNSYIHKVTITAA